MESEGRERKWQTRERRQRDNIFGFIRKQSGIFEMKDIFFNLL